MIRNVMKFDGNMFPKTRSKLNCLCLFSCSFLIFFSNVDIPKAFDPIELILHVAPTKLTQAHIGQVWCSFEHKMWEQTHAFCYSTNSQVGDLLMSSG